VTPATTGLQKKQQSGIRFTTPYPHLHGADIFLRSPDVFITSSFGARLETSRLPPNNTFRSRLFLVIQHLQASEQTRIDLSAIFSAFFRNSMSLRPS
jgi:hypothetical protein